MSKTIGKISPIKRDYSNTKTVSMESELSKRGFTRSPGTGRTILPYKELTGIYRTGLDKDAVYIQRIGDSVEKKLETERVSKLKEKLETLLRLDLGNHSTFWNYALATRLDDVTHVQPYKLTDGDNLFDLNSPFQELTFSWLRVHPTIASSYKAWENGDFPADTQFYVADEEIENAITFRKNQLINKAITKFDNMTPEKKRKVARLLGLPVVEESKDEFVYNLVDKILKQTSFKTGPFNGFSTVEIFNRFADMKENLLHIKDLIKQATSHSIYRVRPDGHIYEGEYEVAKDEEDLVRFLVDDNNQDALITLEQKLKTKKLAAV